MHTGPHYTAPRRPSGPTGGRNRALLIGGISFALVFLLIVGATVGYLVLRSSGSSGGAEGGGGSASATETTISSEPVTTEASPTSPPETTPIEEERHCWYASNERVSQNPSGRLRGGGLEMVPPAGFDSRANRTFLAFTTDAQTASAPIEGTWVSSIMVGKIEWQPGVEYPGDKAASERLISCMYGSSTIWGDTSQRTLHDQVTEAVTVAGMPGYRTTATLKFGKHNFEKFESTRLEVVVVSTPEGPSVFASDVAIGVTEHEDGATEAYKSLTGLSG